MTDSHEQLPSCAGRSPAAAGEGPAQRKALVMMSGGLDSILAARLMLDQPIEVSALHVFHSFCSHVSASDPRLPARVAAERLRIPLAVVDASEEFLAVVKDPKHGYGRNMNPCIDCRIFVLKVAAERMKEMAADFLVTGEVPGQRPMSQRRQAMQLIERESGLEGLILRPLCAQLLEPTIPEERGWVDRSLFLDLHGRSRKPQMALAAKYGITHYPSPAGGCLLTDPGFSVRLRDLMAHNPDFDVSDAQLLRYGRHFRLSPEAKVVVARDAADCAQIGALTRKGDLLLELADAAGPLTLARGKMTPEQIHLAGAITARFSRARNRAEVRIKHWAAPDGEPCIIPVSPAKGEEIQSLRTQ